MSPVKNAYIAYRKTPNKTSARHHKLDVSDSGKCPLYCVYTTPPSLPTHSEKFNTFVRHDARAAACFAGENGQIYPLLAKRYIAEFIHSTGKSSCVQVKTAVDLFGGLHE